jgi:hypothetical protein
LTLKVLSNFGLQLHDAKDWFISPVRCVHGLACLCVS